MRDADNQLHVILKEYDNFLRDKDLALPKHRPYLVRWVQQFVHFARARCCADDGAYHRPALSHVVIRAPQRRHSRRRLYRLVDAAHVYVVCHDSP